MNPQQVCIVCNYNAHPLELINLERLAQFLSRKVDTTKVYKVKNFYWNTNNKCNYGMRCNKTNTFDNSFRKIISKLNVLLTGYIEQTDCEDYHEILRYLQGYQPTVYREFELEIRKHQSNN